MVEEYRKIKVHTESSKGKVSELSLPNQAREIVLGKRGNVIGGRLSQVHYVQ